MRGAGWATVRNCRQAKHERHATHRSLLLVTVKAWLFEAYGPVV